MTIGYMYTGVLRWDVNILGKVMSALVDEHGVCVCVCEVCVNLCLCLCNCKCERDGAALVLEKNTVDPTP